MVKINTLFQTKTAKKNIPFGAVHTYIAYIRDYPPPPPTPRAKNALQIMSLAAYTSETNWASVFFRCPSVVKFKYDPTRKRIEGDFLGR